MPYRVSSSSRYTPGNLTGQLLWKHCEAGHNICDVTIKLQGEESIKAHWCVLLHCPFFEAMYDSGLQEKMTATLTLDIVPAETAKLALKFLYTQSIDIPKDTFRDMFKMADYLQMEQLKEACLRTLESAWIIDHTNCLEFLQLGEMYDMENLKAMAENEIESNFEKVASGTEILQMRADYLIGLMNNPVLKRVRGEVFFNLLLRWVKESDERTNDFPRLFACIDLKDIALDTLKGMTTNTHVKQHAECEKVLADHLSLIESGGVDPTDNNKEVLVFIGVQDYAKGDKEKKIHCYAYVIDENKWTQFAYLPQCRLGVPVLYGPMRVIGEKAYVCGQKAIPGPLSSIYEPSVDSMLLVQLRPDRVKQQWDEVCFDNTNYKTVCVYSIAEMNDGGMVSLREDKEGYIHLKIDQPSYVQWCSDHGSYVVPESQKTSLSYVVMRKRPFQYNCPEDLPDSAKRFVSVGKSFVVCGKESIFIYIGLRNEFGVPIAEKLFVFSMCSNLIEDCTSAILKEGYRSCADVELAYLEGNSVRLVGYNNPDDYVFNLESKTLKVRPKQGLPALAHGKKCVEEVLVRHKEDMYMLALIGKKRSSVNVLYKLEEKKWVEVSTLPIKHGSGLIAAEGGSMKVNKFKMCCPVSCSDCDETLIQNWRDHYFEISYWRQEMREPHSST